MQSLVDFCIKTIVSNLRSYTNNLHISLQFQYLPADLLQKIIFQSISKRKISDATLPMLLHENVVSLALGGAANFITDQSILKMQRCVNLKQLSLYSCFNMSDQTLSEAFKVSFLRV
jgi:hypothetical protein